MKFVDYICAAVAIGLAQLSMAQFCMAQEWSMRPAFASDVAEQECRVTDMKIGGYVGERIETCVNERVKKENVAELIGIFRYRNETRYWQSEFFGKWAQGAVESYKYTKDPELLELLRSSFAEFMDTQSEDGYIGNYAPDAQFAQWDIWGRKYSALALLAYYRLTGEDRALTAAKRLVSHLMGQLHERNVDIASTGNYLGMASCSILEPVVYLYEFTREERFLDFAKEIVASMEAEGSSQLLAKSDVSVSQRTPHPEKWWSFENGQKAYEMMSCYVGLMELGRVLDDAIYFEAARRAFESIRAEEINVAGSGSAFECWYGGRERQTLPTYHTMETCVTFTYMQFCSRLFLQTGEPRYVDEFERSMYNALFASMKDDGGEIAKYSPLEGRRTRGEEQCGMHINCCNANGPRGFALIPQMALTTRGDAVFVNMYMPVDAKVAMGKKDEVALKVDTDFPVSGEVTIEVSPSRTRTFTLALRIPQYVSGAEVWVNGERVEAVAGGEVEVGMEVEVEVEVEVEGNGMAEAEGSGTAQAGSTAAGGYVYLTREWKEGDCVTLRLGIETRTVAQNNCVAVVRGPVVFARDSRFGDGDVDECLVISQDERGTVNAQLTENEGFAWLTLSVPAVLGTDLENPENKAVRQIRFCDFSSAGNDWSPDGRYRVWLPQTLHVMTEPYRGY